MDLFGDICMVPESQSQEEPDLNLLCHKMQASDWSKNVAICVSQDLVKATFLSHK